MSGALLRSGGLRDFDALGAVGHPVYQSATQLRIAMRSQIGADVADSFAIPKRNDSGDIIDWYAPQEGLIVPWTSATEEERGGALRALQAIRERVLSAGRRLRAESDSERQVFGRLLQHVMTFPDDQHVYLVDGKPVLTFWGFSRHGAPSAMDSLALLAAPVTSPAPMTSAAPVSSVPETAEATVVGRRWPWWLWPLLLSLLLIPLLFWFRSCSDLPTVGLPSFEPPRLPGADTSPAPDDPDATQSSGAGQGPADAGSGADETGPEGADDAGDGDPPPTGEEAELPAATEEPQPESPNDASQAPAEDPQDEPPVPPAPDMTPGAEDSANEPPPLQIPPDALQQGNLDFLNGRWNSNSGLIDETGRPVKLEYEFKNGEGSVSVRRSDGSVCRGDTSASIVQKRLVITDKGQIRCPDAQFFEPSMVDCTVGEGGQADCNGRYATGGAFPVEIREAE